MKNYFLGKGLTIPFNYVTCVQIGAHANEGMSQIYVSLMVNTIPLYNEDANNFLSEYHIWLDNQ